MSIDLVRSTGGRTSRELLAQLDKCDQDATSFDSNAQAMVAGPFTAFRICKDEIPLMFEQDQPDDNHPTTPPDAMDEIIQPSEQLPSENIIPDGTSLQLICDFSNIDDLNAMDLPGWCDIPTPQLSTIPTCLTLPSCFSDYQDGSDGGIGGNYEAQNVLETTTSIPHLAVESRSGFTLSDDTPLLFRYFEEHVIKPQTSFFRCRKSCHSLLLRCAKEAYADISFRGKASETRLAIFHVLLAISAFHMSRTNSGRDSKMWHDRGIQAQEETKSHLELALKSENRECKSSKYKEILLATLAMAISSVSTTILQYKYFDRYTDGNKVF